MATDNKNSPVCRVGIAGYMGAGKSTLSRLVAQGRKGTLLINADAEAKALMQRDRTIRDGLTKHFGPAIIDNDGINFKLLGGEVFQNRGNLLALNTIVHPSLLVRLKELIAGSSAGLIVCDAALIPLWGIEAWFDRTLWVHSPFKQRLARLQRLAALPRGQLVQRMNLQQGLFEPPQKAPWEIVENNATLDQLKKAAEKVILDL